jgi:hypothetical protein
MKTPRKKTARTAKPSTGTARTHSFSEFLGEELARDPAFAEAFQKEIAKPVTKRLGRPPSRTAKKGTREMRFDAPATVAEKIRAAAERDGRSVSNWLLRAAKHELARDETK